MPTLAAVKAQIAKCPGSYIFWTQKEIRALPEILADDEEIKALTSGFMDGATWLAVCTDQRLIFLNRGMFFGSREVILPLDRIQSIDHGFTIVFGFITVWDGASAFTISMVLKPSIPPFIKAAQHIMRELKRGKTSAPSPAPSAAIDIASQLERLAALKEKGHLTEEEFQVQKRKLLS